MGETNRAGRHGKAQAHDVGGSSKKDCGGSKGALGSLESETEKRSLVATLFPCPFQPARIG